MDEEMERACAEEAAEPEAERALEDALPEEEPDWEVPGWASPEEQRRFLAEERGMTEAELLTRLCRETAAGIGRRCLESCGGDRGAARLAYSRYWEDREAAARGRAQEEDRDREERLLERLAGEFDALREQVPAVREPEELPPEVLRQAAEGIPLFDAYLRYEWAERRGAESQRQVEAHAASCSAGGLLAEPDEPRAEQETFTAVFREAVR